MQDLDTMTNVILNNEYKLHEEEQKTNFESGNNGNNNQNNNSNKTKKRRKKKKTLKQKLLLVLKIIIGLIILFVLFIFLFFKTSLFQKYKELWVETAMSTMNHQYLATWFLSDEEIQEILSNLEVQNNEDSNSNEINIDYAKEQKEEENITVEKIKGTNYVGYVMIVKNPTKVKYVDARKSSIGTKLSQIVKENNAIAGINAGGFADDGGVGAGNLLCDATIINKKLLYGNKSSRYSFIGLSNEGKLVLGKYTYQEALNAGIQSAVEFGPFIIVNGKNQIKNSNSGGIHPRMAIGQRKDGTFIFVVIDGRQPGYSIGTNLLELQNIFNRYDAYNAANLDGGSSATMYYNGKVVNKTSTPIGERYLPNAIIVEK